MKICDKCIQPTRAVDVVHIEQDDSWFDLCEKHRDELFVFLQQQEKQPMSKTLFRTRKNLAKAK